MAKGGDLMGKAGGSGPGNIPRKPAAPGLTGLTGHTNPSKPPAPKPVRGQQQPGGGKAPVARRPKV